MDSKFKSAKNVESKSKYSIKKENSGKRCSDYENAYLCQTQCIVGLEIMSVLEQMGIAL